MRNSLIILFLFLSTLIVRSQYITSESYYMEGTSSISTSRIEALHTKDKDANQINLSMDYIRIKGPGHSVNNGEYYTLQMNFFERNIGQTILLKCKNGKVIELNANSLQRDPFVQIYWTKENIIKEIAEGEIIKIRIKTKKSYIDREIRNNTFSSAVKKCYNLLTKTKRQKDKELKEASNFRLTF